MTNLGDSLNIHRLVEIHLDWLELDTHRLVGILVLIRIQSGRLTCHAVSGPLFTPQVAYSQPAPRHRNLNLLIQSPLNSFVKSNAGQHAGKVTNMKNLITGSVGLTDVSEIDMMGLR